MNFLDAAHNELVRERQVRSKVFFVKEHVLHHSRF